MNKLTFYIVKEPPGDDYYTVHVRLDPRGPVNEYVFPRIGPEANRKAWIKECKLEMIKKILDADEQD